MAKTCTKNMPMSPAAHRLPSESIAAGVQSLGVAETQSNPDIIAEYPLVIDSSAPPTALFRFPIPLKGLPVAEIHRKPVCGATRVRLSLPKSNILALRAKQLNATSIAYGAMPAPASDYYAAFFTPAGAVVLRPIKDIYLFEPQHEYYALEPMKEELRRAETREELLQRRNSYVYKLRNALEEEYRPLSIEDATLPAALPEKTGAEAADSAPVQVPGADAALLAEITGCVMRARIVNTATLLKMFKDSVAVTAVLARLTEPLCGRRVLKTNQYETALREPRAQLLRLFAATERIPIADTFFLGKEQWLADELAVRDGRFYCLHGFREAQQVNTARLHEQNVANVNAILAKEGFAPAESIAARCCLDEDTVYEILQSRAYIHLANNCYASRDESAQARALALFESARTVAQSVIDEALQDEADAEDFLAALRQHTTHRNGKYYLKLYKGP